MNKQWKSLDDLNDTEAFQEELHREFPKNASVFEDDVSRRDVLKLMGAGFALAGVSGCSIRKPVQKIIPYAKRPEHDKPGEALYIATSMAVGSDVSGLLVKSQEGRPTKIEGNPDYPRNLGGTTSIQQASVLDLYDPDRLKKPLENQSDSDIKSFLLWKDSFLKNLSKTNGKDTCILIESTVSPSFYNLVSAFLKKYPQLSVFRYDSFSQDNRVLGLHAITGQYLSCDYLFSKPDVIASFDCDFLGAMNNQSLYTQDFIKRRDPEEKRFKMNRLYCLESNYTLTGGKADHRKSVPSRSIYFVLCRFIYHLLKQNVIRIPTSIKSQILSVAESGNEIVSDQFLSAMASDFKNKPNLVVVGDQQPDYVHALAFYVNSLLGNFNRTLVFRKLPFSEFSFNQVTSRQSIQAFSDFINKGRAKTVLMIGGNPVYHAPIDLDIVSGLKKAKQVVCLSTAQNETTEYADWVIPRSHYLESWSDLVAVDGTYSVVQPVIRPMYKSLSDLEFLLALLGRQKSGYQVVQQTFRRKMGSSVFDEKWRLMLHRGFFDDQNRTFRPSFQSSLLIKKLREGPVFYDKRAIELVFSVNSGIYDGRNANNAWLQELPDFMTKLTWDNALLVSVKTAQNYHLKTEQMVTIQSEGRELKCPVYILPGHADYSVTLYLGYGRRVSGRVGTQKGFDANQLRTTQSFDLCLDIQLIQHQETYSLASTQDHWSMEGRPHVRYASLSDYKKKPSFAKDMVHTMPLKSLFPEFKYDKGYQWGMTIDLSKCTGCNACIVACQAENNIPTVGKEEVLNGREMHWLRLDRYFEGDVNEPKALTQPVACIHCENAPCEQVCPVAATVHDEEGLNGMVYNRCVGTRYCADNCPAKVRRFNFFDYHQKNPQSKPKERKHLFDYVREPEKSVQMQFNKDVTVRMRGVMEKCTYCVQRIKAKTQLAANEDRLVGHGEIQTACQQACAADSVSFGNILDEDSQVAKDKKKARNYEILNELHLKARTSFLALITNPNPALVKDEDHVGSTHA